jgi:hypothetical protein
VRAALVLLLCFPAFCQLPKPGGGGGGSGGGGGGGGSVFTGSTAVASAFSATPTFSLADVSVKSPVRFEPGAMTANVTAVTFTSKTAGAKFSIAWLQDGTGSRTVADGATNTCAVVPDASSLTVKEYEVAADGATVNVVNCTSNAASSMLTIGAVPPTAPAGSLRCGGVTASASFACTNAAGVTSYLGAGTTISTQTNCSSSASPAVCAAAPAGSVAFPTGVTSVALTVNTTAVTANSQIFISSDDSLGTKLGVTCNSTLATLVGGIAITARTAGTSFQVTYSGTIATNPLCANFLIVN